MRGKRELVAEFLDRSGGLSLLLRARAHLRLPTLTVVTWHRISDPRAEESFDDGAIDATPAEFDWQVGQLVRHFTIVTLRQVEAALTGAPLPRNAALLSFDDGYRECHDVALPVLRRHGVTATFFLPTAYIGAPRLFWWERINLALRRSRARTLRLDYPSALELPLGGEATSAALAQVIKLVKTTRGLDLPRFLEDVERAADQPLSAAAERQLADRMLITWDQARALRAAGMDIASHTRTHRVLGTLDTAALDDELAGSRADLEAALDTVVHSIAYPVGFRVLDQPEVLDALGRAGYRLGLTNRPGWNVWPLAHPFDVRRVRTERGMPRAMFRASLSLPAFAS